MTKLLDALPTPAWLAILLTALEPTLLKISLQLLQIRSFQQLQQLQQYQYLFTARKTRPAFRTASTETTPA